MDSKISQEDCEEFKSTPKGILVQREPKKRAFTYTHNTAAGIKKKKKVNYIDRTTNSNLCQVFKYEQVDVPESLENDKSTSCACTIS